MMIGGSKYGTRAVKAFNIHVKNERWKWGYSFKAVIHAPTSEEAIEEYRERFMANKIMQRLIEMVEQGNG